MQVVRVKMQYFGEKMQVMFWRSGLLQMLRRVKSVKVFLPPRARGGSPKVFLAYYMYKNIRLFCNI